MFDDYIMWASYFWCLYDITFKLWYFHVYGKTLLNPNQPTDDITTVTLFLLFVLYVSELDGQ